MKTVRMNDDVPGALPRRRRLRSLRFAPALMTLGNLICGFAACYFALRASHEQVATPVAGERALPSFLVLGAWMVLLGMVLDCFDGLVARMTRSTTDFGGQLDSLADMVTFGLAPAILVIAFMMKMKELAGDALFPSPMSEHVLGRAVWVFAAMYVAFAAIRLARYNVEHARHGFDRVNFRGLPSPGAALLIVAFVMFQDVGTGAQAITTYTLPAATLGVGLLMVSRVPYRRVFETYVAGRRPFSQVVLAMALLAAFWVAKGALLLFLALAYVLSGPAAFLVRRFLRPADRHGHTAARSHAAEPASVTKLSR